MPTSSITNDDQCAYVMQSKGVMTEEDDAGEIEEEIEESEEDVD